MFWLDWRELEKHNDWGVRDKDDATAALWNDGAEQWEKRSAGEVGFAQKQVDALTRITKETMVLDVCCGTGPLTLPLAKKARQVTAFDFNEKMLDFVRRKAAEADLVVCGVRGLSGVKYALVGSVSTHLIRHSSGKLWPSCDCT